jgi:thymidylate synthase
MRQYLELLERIYKTGKSKHPTRVEKVSETNNEGKVNNPTIGLANLHLDYDLSNGFPLLTTRKLPWMGCVGELRSFLKGDTNNKQFIENGCKFWTPWSQPDGNLGPIYGKQWNNHGQLDHVLSCLRFRPTDRRMVVSAWRPDEHPLMVLPPCHLMWVITPYDNKLNLSWIQRSCDFPIGVPVNIASYALLTHLLAAWAGMAPGNLSCIFCDAHIYENQLEGVETQLKRVPDILPTVEVWFEDEKDFHSWQVELINWYPQPNINFGELEV